jgi:hypothetical protein
MTERKKPNENTFTNVGFSDTLPKPAWSWKEIIRTSIEISNETLMPGEFGVTVARGTFSCSVEKRKESCSVKMLKGTIIIALILHKSPNDNLLNEFYIS